MKRLLAALAVTATVVLLLAVLIDLPAATAVEGAEQAARELSPGGLALALLLYALSYVGRGLRLALLLPGPTRLGLLVSISARHNLFNLLLPLRSGEASLPLMLRSESGRPLAEGAAALLVARVLDLLSVAAWLMVGLSVTRSEGDPSLPTRAALILALLLVGLATLRPVAGLAQRRLADREHRLLHFVARAAGHLAEQPSGRLLAAMAVSLLTWLLTYGACFALISDMAGSAPGVPAALAGVDFSASLVGSTMLHLAGILPINTLAGVGPWEAGWTAGYLLVGVERGAALASAVVSHAAILAFVCLLGGLGWLTRGRSTGA